MPHEADDEQDGVEMQQPPFFHFLCQYLEMCILNFLHQLKERKLLWGTKLCLCSGFCPSTCLIHTGKSVYTHVLITACCLVMVRLWWGRSGELKERERERGELTVTLNEILFSGGTQLENIRARQAAYACKSAHTYTRDAKRKHA